MARPSKTPTPPAPGFQLGRDFDLALWHDAIAIDQVGRVHCYVGFANDDQDETDHPYSFASAGRNARESSNFIKLVRGTITKTRFLDADTYYRIVSDRRLVLPTGANSYFGVANPEDKWSEDHALTQAIFGGSYQEVAGVAASLAKVFGRARYDLPRVTFSKTRSNRCDLTNAVIPREFPYVAFEGAQHDWSHVSLHGFYRLLSLTCGDRSPIRAAIIDDGVEEPLLNHLIECSESNTRPVMAGRYD